MISFALSFMSGIAAFKYFLFFPVLITASGIAAAVFLFFRRRDAKYVSFITLIFLFGFFYSFLRQEKVSEITLPDREVFFEGTVVDVPEASGGKVRFTIDNVRIGTLYIDGKVRLSVLPEILDKDRYPAFGDRIRAFAKLREPDVFRNPGVYSYNPEKYGITAAGYVKQMQVIGIGAGFLSRIYKMRQSLAWIIDNSLSPENASFHKAIILGFQKGITKEMRDAFSATGLAHLLSISGTHFALLAFIIFTLVKTAAKFLPIKILTKMTLHATPSQAAVVLTMPVLILYALISGSSTPTVRSLVMIFIYMLALFLGRKGQWLNSLAVAAAVILIWQPDALLELSFQLSFIAVLSTGYALEIAGRKNEADNAHESANGFRGLKFVRTITGKIKISLLITIAAIMGTAPVALYYFYQFPVISPVTNLLITPFVCFAVLPAGFFAGFFALVVNMNSLPAGRLIDVVTDFPLALTKYISHMPFSSLHLHKPPVIIIALYFLSLAFFVKSKSKWRLLPLMLVFCFYIASSFIPKDKNLRITFLDVGQGDASFIEFPDERVMLVDGGAEDFDAGRRVIAPYLWAKGIKKIDYMALSHPHPDHFGGLIYLMDNFKVGEAWLNGRNIPGAVNFFSKLSEKGIPAHVFKRGDALEGMGYSVYALHPYNEFYASSSKGEFSNQNSDSLVLKIESRGAAALFTGDIEAEAEENLIHLGSLLKCGIIKAPHHGSRTSSSVEFIEAVGPQIMVVSAGKNNPFNHPHAETIDKYRRAGARIFRTDRDGAVVVTFRNKGYEVTTWQDSMLRKVENVSDEIRNLRVLL